MGVQHPRATQITQDWQTLISAGGMDVQDAATIVNPDTEIDTADGRIVLEVRKGSVAHIRMRYAGTPSQNPIVKLFGRHNANGKWQILTTLAGGKTSVVITNSAGDVTDGTLKATHPDPFEHAFNLQGCKFIKPGLETAFAVSAGDVNAALLEVRFT